MGIFISIPQEEIDNVAEQTCITTTEEVALEVVDVSTGVDKNGFNYISPLFKAIDHPDAKQFSKFLSLPSEGMTQEKLNKALRGLKYFYTALGVDYSQGVDTDSLIGMKFWALIGVDAKHAQVEEYGPQNYIKRFIGPIAS